MSLRDNKVPLLKALAKLKNARPDKEVDPTRTIMLRRALSNDADKRFNKIKAEIRDAIVTMDVFGFKSNVAKEAFRFKTDTSKVTEFMDWLEELVDKGVLGVNIRRGRKIVARHAWMNTYISSAYRKGIARGYSELSKVGDRKSVV